MNIENKGKRVKLINMENDPNPIEKGMEGTIQFEDDMGNIHVKWDNGRVLSLIPTEDEYEMIEESSKIITSFETYVKESMEINSDGELVDTEGDGFKNIMDDMSFEEQEFYFDKLVKKYKVDSPRILGTKKREYWFPLEAKEDLDSMGITWYEEERITNNEHPDYGKTFLVFTWAHQDFSKK